MSKQYHSKLRVLVLEDHKPCTVPSVLGSKTLNTYSLICGF